MSAPTATLGAAPRMKVRRRAPGISSGMWQLASVGALVGATSLLAVVHLASVARPFFLLGALAMAVRAIRRDPWSYLTLTLWFWSIAPFARRVVDYYGGFVFANIMLITPNVISVLMIRDILASRDVWRREGAGIGLMMLVPVLYGIIVSFLNGDVVPGLVSAADWLTPLIYFYYILNLTPRVREAEPHFRTFIVLNLALVTIYGLVQFVVAPAWDVEWVQQSKMITVGQPVPFGLKPFSTLNSPGTSAMWLAMLLILSLHFRQRLSLLLLPAATLMLGLTLVRSAMGVAAAGIAGAVLLGRGQVLRAMLPLMLGGAVAVGVGAMLDPSITASMTARLDTFTDLAHDPSGQARVQIYEATPGWIAMEPFGEGIGAFGRGAREQTGSTEAGAMDSGPLEVFLALGWLGGTSYLVGILIMTLRAVAAGRAAASPAALPFGMASISTAGAILFVNIIGLAGCTIFLCAAMAIALRANERSATAAYRAAGGVRAAFLAPAPRYRVATAVPGPDGSHTNG